MNKKHGHLCGVEIMRKNNNEFGLLATNQKMKIDYAHQVLGHPGMVKTIATARHLGWLVETKDMKCIDCQIGKAKQKNLNKSDQAKVLSYFIDEIEAETDKEVKIIRCDNAGENKTTEERFIREKRNIKFEYTARNTPQQNGKVERAFATLYGRMRAMMNYAGIAPEKPDKIWTEAAATATKLENILVDKKDDKSAYEKVYGKIPD